MGAREEEGEQDIGVVEQSKTECCSCGKCSSTDGNCCRRYKRAFVISTKERKI